MVDYLAPEKETPGQEYLALWRAVLINAFRDSMIDSDHARLNAAWTRTANFKRVCEFAGVAPNIAKAKFLELHQGKLNNPPLLKGRSASKTLVRFRAKRTYKTKD